MNSSKQGRQQLGCLGVLGERAGRSLDLDSIRYKALFGGYCLEAKVSVETKGAVMKRRVYVAAVLLAAVTVAGSSDPKKDGDFNRAIEEDAETEERGVMRQHDIRGWALGCAAVLTERNHDSHALLGGCGLSGRDIKEKTQILSEAWGIDSREDLFDRLACIEGGGHRVKFQMWGAYTSSLSEEEYREVLNSDQSDADTRQQMMIARKYYKDLGDKSLYGWDYSRYIRLCRWGYVAGYITEDEAWNQIIPVARTLQRKFDSWRDLGRNYLIGRRFWSGQETERSGWECEDAFRRLLDMRSSPWNRYDWDMDLSETGNIDRSNRRLTGGPIARG
jgi:hypothetical protein